MEVQVEDELIPKALYRRRLHSLMGIWLTIFLMEHLLVNSQAAYFFGEDGRGFIHAVNGIHDLPYLQIIEFLILGLPIFFHMFYGIGYLFSAKYNAFGKGLTAPKLSYERNYAYTFQRITSYVLVIGIILHVIQMRFLEYPIESELKSNDYYMVLVQADEGLYPLSERLNVELFDEKRVSVEKLNLLEKENFHSTLQSVEEQEKNQRKNFIEALEKYPLKNGELIAVAKDFGTAELLMVRETFKIPLMIALYTVFVLAACFHAFNGLWTFLVSWGITKSEKSRNIFLKISYGLMFLFSFLGLSAIYATYWINLKN